MVNTATNQVDCDNWKGFQLVSGYAGVFGMRRVKFPSGFHSQVQAADSDVLDFIIAFHIAEYTGSTSNLAYEFVTAQYINSYTINALPLSDAKISFVNFSD